MNKSVIIMGAAGRDFHVFNTCFRDQPDVRVLAFTAAQIPDIDGRKYPKSLAGIHYPEGIPIEHESNLVSLIKQHSVDEVVFAYSDVSYDYIKEKEELVRAAGADFRRFDEPVEMFERTMLHSSRPVIAVCAVRTGAGKSPASRRIATILRDKGRHVVAVRHPMPYGDLEKQAVQRFASMKDMADADCTIEEMEEYEPHIENGVVVYAGVDYERILREAEKEADVIIWDGGNNDTPFFKPDLHITIADPLRAGHELSYFPGKVNLEMADVVLINKVDQATSAQVSTVVSNTKDVNPHAKIIRCRMPLTISDPDVIKGKRVLVIEDGPTLTHGQMTFGAGVVAARQFGASEIVDPRPFVIGKIADTFKAYPDIGPLLPAMGYSLDQINDLEETINAAPVDAVVIATPIDLARLIRIDKPFVRVGYELETLTSPGLEKVLIDF